jgi:hypothetical protein
MMKDLFDFIDNYENKQKWYEKYTVGENYLNGGKLNMKVIIYGY